jgi:O-antigen/teichoic acid export membrane protein
VNVGETAVLEGGPELPDRLAEPKDAAGFLSRRSLVSSFAFNLGGELAAVALGLVCIPYVVRRLGADSFGILSLAWVLLFYMSLFDLGLSRATTKFAAEAIGKDDHQLLPPLLGTSLTLQFVLGLLGGSLLFVLSSWLAGRLLKIPGPLVIEAVRCFKILALAVPVVLITNCLRGMLEALQRFDLINCVKVPTSASMFLCPLLILPFGGRLPSIVLVMTVFRFAAMFVYLRFCLAVLPKPGIQFDLERTLLVRLLKYGSWITVSNVTGPILMYLDRFMIGTVLSIGAVAYYTAPADMISRALVVPASLGSILFPTFSSLNAAGAKERLSDFYARSIKYLIIGLGPLLLVAAAFSQDILGLWLGPAFAEKSTLSFQILTAGIFINSLGFFPYSLLQGLGKPKLTGLFHLAELPIHVALVWILVNRMGIVGAAIASTLRVLIDTILLFGACHWLRLTSSPTLLKQRVIQCSLTLAVCGAAVFTCAATGLSFFLRVGITAALLGCYAMAQWRWSLDQHEREFVRALDLGAILRPKKAPNARSSGGLSMEN